MRLSAFQPGIGDNLDLKAKSLYAGEIKEKLSYTLQTKGSYTRNIPIYPTKNFEYRFAATGKQQQWISHGDILLQLNYYPRKTAVYALQAEYFDPTAFPYQVQANIEYEVPEGLQYNVDVEFQVYARGRQRIAQSAFNYRVSVDINFVTNIGQAGTTTVHSDWVNTSVENRHYDYDTARAISTQNAAQIAHNAVQTFLSSRPDISSHTINNYRASTNNIEYIAFTNPNGSQVVSAFTTRWGPYMEVSNGVTYTTRLNTSNTLGGNINGTVQRAHQQTIQNLLASAVLNANLEVREYYIIDNQNIAGFHIDNQGVIWAFLSGEATTGKSQVVFEYSVNSLINYIDNNGALQQATITSDSLRAAVTQSTINHVVSLRTPREIMAPYISGWRVQNQIQNITGITYNASTLSIVNSIVAIIPANRVSS